MNLDFGITIPTIITTTTAVVTHIINKEVIESSTINKDLTETPIITTQINDENFPLGGRLLHFHQRWKNFPVSDLIVDWIQNGIPIDSDSDLWKNYHQRNFSKEEKAWIVKEIQSMEKDGIIVPSINPVINPINVVPKKGSDQFRFILDLRKVNDGITSDTFKMESVQRVMKFIRKGMWACKIDLKKGYFHVPIRRESQQLLGFSFEGKTYQFTCLPFGLSTAPRSFTKIMKEVVKKWRQLGIIIFIYIDDILILAESEEMVKNNTQQIVTDLEYLGWLLQPEKSVLIPSQTIIFLGLEFDLINGKIQIPQEKKEIAQDLIDKFIKAEMERSFVNIKLVAKFIGKMEFLSLAEPAIMPFLDRLRKQMNQRVDSKGWKSTMLINRGPAKDLKTLKRILSQTKGVWLELETPESIILNTDASLENFAAHSGNIIIIGRFQEETSINVKELKAILQFFLEASKQKMFPRGTHFEIRGDNSTALSYARKGYGYLEHLSSIARDIWKILKSQDWHISKVIYIPSKENKVADRLSRLGDWKSSQELIDMVEEEFGHHTVDRFARSESAITITYNSWLENDAFFQLWEKDSISYCVPPLGLIPQALTHLIKSRAKGTFVVPDWPTSHWYPILLKVSLKIRRVPRKLLIVEQSTELFNKFENQIFLVAQVNGELYYQ